MQINQGTWTVDRLFSERENINLNPQWQRGPAWNPPRQVLLIDSILRGMDIPKVYLRVRNGDAVFTHDAVDGQQRLRALWEFRSGKLPLDYSEPLAAVNGHAIASLRYDHLHQDLKDRFDAFEVSVAEILTGTNDDIAALFARLQMGVPLNPAELRNAMLHPLNRIMASIAESHEFFAHCRISSARSKHLDYITHVFAVLRYATDRDLKAPDLKRMVIEVTDTDSILELASRAGAVLNVLDEVNQQFGYRITQKWIFVDLSLLISQRQGAGAAVDAVKLAQAYESFEARRRMHNAQPDVLLNRESAQPTLDRHLYNYIEAFRTQAGTKESLRTRNEALRAFCPDIDVRS